MYALWGRITRIGVRGLRPDRARPQLPVPTSGAARPPSALGERLTAPVDGEDLCPAHRPARRPGRPGAQATGPWWSCATGRTAASRRRPTSCTPLRGGPHLFHPCPAKLRQAGGTSPSSPPADPGLPTVFPTHEPETVTPPCPSTKSTKSVDVTNGRFEANWARPAPRRRRLRRGRQPRTAAGGLARVSRRRLLSRRRVAMAGGAACARRDRRAGCTAARCSATAVRSARA